MLAFAFPALPLAAQEPAQPPAFDLVPEMETPPGVAAAKPSERAALPRGPETDRAKQRATAHVDALGDAIRGVDLVALSRFHVDEMAGYEVPEPFDWQADLIGVAEDGRLSFELRGPRLPASYDIVFRYLTVFVSVDPATGAVGRPVVTIRGWIEE